MLKVAQLTEMSKSHQEASDTAAARFSQLQDDLHAAVTTSLGQSDDASNGHLTQQTHSQEKRTWEDQQRAWSTLCAHLERLSGRFGAQVSRGRDVPNQTQMDLFTLARQRNGFGLQVSDACVVEHVDPRSSASVAAVPIGGTLAEVDGERVRSKHELASALTTRGQTVEFLCVKDCDAGAQCADLDDMTAELARAAAQVKWLEAYIEDLHLQNGGKDEKQTLLEAEYLHLRHEQRTAEKAAPVSSKADAGLVASVLTDSTEHPLEHLQQIGKQTTQQRCKEEDEEILQGQGQEGHTPHEGGHKHEHEHVDMKTGFSYSVVRDSDGLAVILEVLAHKIRVAVSGSAHFEDIRYQDIRSWWNNGKKVIFLLDATASSGLGETTAEGLSIVLRWVLVLTRSVSQSIIHTKLKSLCGAGASKPPTWGRK